MPRAVPASSRPPLRFGAGLSRHFITVDPLMPSDWWAFFFAFLLAGAPLVSVIGGGSLMILTYIATAAALLVLFPSLVVQSLARNWVLLLYFAWAILSIGWSLAPDRTTHEALLIVPTLVAGLGLGGMRKKREVNLGVAAAMFLFMIASVLHGNRVGFNDTGSGGLALTGFAPQKNFFGHLSAMSLLVSFSFFAFGGTRFGRALTLIGCADVALSAYALQQSYAVGSELSALIGIGSMTVVLMFRRVPWGIRVLGIAVLLAIAAVYLTFGSQIEQMLGDAVLAKFNKDTTLTGRTMLWDFADRLIDDHKMLGYGYGGFWTLGNPDAWTVWRMVELPPGAVFNFHNTFRETLIESGTIGLAIYLVGYGSGALRTFLRGLVAGDLSSAVRIAFVLYFIVRLPVESTGIAPVSFDGTFLLASMCVPVRRPVRKEAGDVARVDRRVRAMAAA